MGCPLPFSSGEQQLFSGIVLHAEKDAFLVQCPMQTVRAVRAASCLLRPEQGDSVLVVLPSTGRAWVLAVLMQQAEEAWLDLPAHTSIQAEQMHFCSEEMHLDAQNTLHLQAASLEGTAQNIQLKAGILSLTGGVLMQHFASVRQFARTIAQKCGLLRTDCQKKQEQIEELAEMTAGRIRVQAESSVRVRSESMDMQAKRHVILDGERIKIG